MRITPLFVAGLGLVSILSAVQDTQIRVDVEAVHVFVTVTDKQGKFVTGLPADRFIVYEDGVPQEIVNFSSDADVPIRLGMLIDTSSSVRLKLDFEKRAAVNFLRGIMRRQDRALLVEFDRGVTLLNDFTDETTKVVAEIDKLKAGGGTALWDALYTVARDKMTERGPRKTLIVISDGEDLNSKHSFQETVEMIQASEATVYAIGTSSFGASSSPEGKENLKKIADDTGGTAFFPYSPERLEEAFDLINTELRSQYTIAYSPRDKIRDGRFREIDVRIVDGKGLKLRHRKGYRLPDF